jgi:hypothetical protein
VIEDEALAVAAVRANEIELDALAHAEACGSEREIAVAVRRQAGSLRRLLEQWIVARATRAARGPALGPK